MLSCPACDPLVPRGYGARLAIPSFPGAVKPAKGSQP